MHMGIKRRTHYTTVTDRQPTRIYICVLLHKYAIKYVHSLLD